ncbi:unnamed protein product [Schistosoma margrebowiei]|uniref:Uncharacterized protein n=1 Tax=Schistosoma margrebowiei TaxID=48269 RepID=A0A183LH77_9TREM|nr:unnamed protein product [Schistosoma margrebowiei]
MRQDGVNEDDLLEIKQDISSLRFEIREDRKREVVRAVCQLESLKQELVGELSKQNSILQNVLLPYTVAAATSTSTTTTTPTTTNCTISSYQNAITSIQQTLPKSEIELPLLINIQKKHSLQHYSSMSNTTDQTLNSINSKMKDSKKKYSLNYDKDINHLTKMNEILFDYSWLPNKHNKMNTITGLYIDDWYQFKNEIKIGLKEELVSLIQNKYLIVNNEKLLNELETTNNNDISNQIVSTSYNSLTNENKLDIFQNKICTKHSEKLFPRFTQTNYNFRKNSRQNNNNNTEEIKLSHSKYPDNIEEKSSCSTFKSSSSSPPRSAVPSETLSSALMPSSSSRSHDQYLIASTSKAMKNINISNTSRIRPIVSPTPTNITTINNSSSSGHRNSKLSKDEHNIDENEGIIKIYETSNIHYDDDSSSSTIRK